MSPVLTLFAIATLAIIVALVLGFVLGRHLLVAKSAGEAMLANTIEASLPKPHILINNVTLPNDNGTTQIDHVLITPTGIFVIETKHYQGWIFGNQNQSHWTQTI